MLLHAADSAVMRKLENDRSHTILTDPIKAVAGKGRIAEEVVKMLI
jgi:hypothetical protein